MLGDAESGDTPLPRIAAGWPSRESCRWAAAGGYRCGVPDAIFSHPRLAAVYDAFDGPRDDLAAYVSIAGELGADRVLDVGCQIDRKSVV